MPGVTTLNPGANPNDAGDIRQPQCAGELAIPREPVDFANHIDVALLDPATTLVRFGMSIDGAASKQASISARKVG